METQTQKRDRQLKKVTTEIVKLSDLDTGDSVEGTFTGKTTAPWLDRATGEEKELTRIKFTRDDGTEFIVFEDAGLRNAMANAMVEVGDYMKIVKLDQVELKGGRRVNSYDIFVETN